MTEALGAFHDANPARAGMGEDDLLGALEVDSAVAKMALAELIDRGAVHRQGTVLTLAGRGELLGEKERLLCRRIGEALREAHLQPPLLSDLTASLGANETDVQAMVRLLADQAAVVVLDRKVVMHRDAVQAARKVALELFAKSGSFETVQFRDALGVSRKYAVPLLDYFDRTRLTVRSGSRRTPGAEARRPRGQTD